MGDRNLAASFTGDTRGVAPLVGFILLFGFLILALTSYQATIVPQQNAQTEFDHFEDVRTEMIELRNAVSTAGQADVSQFPSVKLGTSYPNRFLTINPPSPSGTLRTSEPYNITVSNGSEPYDTNITTRFVEYRPKYYEMRVGSTWYEHSVLYLDDRDQGSGLSIIEDQNIVKDGTVRITALQNSFQKTSTGRVTLELYPQEQLTADDLPEGENLTVTVPTRLDEEEYWNKSLNDTGDIYQGVDVGAHAADVHALNLSVDSDDLEVNTVGVRTEPENPVTNVDRSTGNGIDDEVRVFNADDTWDVPDGVTEVEVLVVGGGGSGGSVNDFSSAGGGGGGAGGVVYETGYSVTPGDTIDVIVGSGGNAPGATTNQRGTNGENSEFDTLVALGGGGGSAGEPGNADSSGKNGGSGGGSRSEDSSVSGGEGQQDTSSSGGFGSDGGRGQGSSGTSQGAGGGGGAGEAGSSNSNENGGDGGDGKYFGDRFGDDIGVTGWVAGGGGGGGTDSSTPGSGGQGGGGDGSVTGGDPAGAGEPNTGSGGGGGGSSSVSTTSPGDGGSGVVVIRWIP